ncbi:hypothetical protein DASC09_039010 [Saccharomycopsis crataegensis]|uniref:DUF2433 domain-containing protein n=1 Tax=Saccharomycopsis crataegensis TaxID=43959 RepID=A0AAV5QPT2_9ASCO|nr:hypothetical protein DASC09_039010 [Saccharomycopsis crataegensis]
MDNEEVLIYKGFRILCVAELRGELHKLNVLAAKHNASIIIHTGNFGFFDEKSVSRIHESYLRHIIAFSPLVGEQVKEKVNRLSKVSPANEFSGEGKLIDYVQHEILSELPRFLKGELKFNVPVYTIYGMIEDTSVINRFKLGIYKIPNLHLIDESNVYDINISELNLNLCLFGLGGSLNISKLFFHGTYDDSIQAEVNKIPSDHRLNDNFFVPTSGDPGNLWITLLQIGRFIKTVSDHFSTNPSASKNSVKLFITHSSPSKESLLGHLGIFLKADYIISNSLHFLYSSSYNELSICPNYEFFKNKFIDSKLQLIKIWKNIKSTIELITEKEENPNKQEISELFEIALNCFDRIPISSSTLAPNSSLTVKNGNPKDFTSSTTNKNIIPLSLYNKTSLANDPVISKRQNDAYYSAFQNLWHFNLCDLNNGYIVLNVQDSRFQMESFSTGFDFSFRNLSTSEQETQSDNELSDIIKGIQSMNPNSAGYPDESFEAGQRDNHGRAVDADVLEERDDEGITIKNEDEKGHDTSYDGGDENNSSDETSFDKRTERHKGSNKYNGRGRGGKNNGHRGRGNSRGRGRGSSRGRVRSGRS